MHLSSVVTLRDAFGDFEHAHPTQTRTNWRVSMIEMTAALYRGTTTREPIFPERQN